jgi:transposase-like protein
MMTSTPTTRGFGAIISKQLSITVFNKHFGTEEQCIAHLEAIRWPNGLRCLKCDGERISRIKALGKTGKLRHLYLCLDCEYQYSVTVGTIFHDSHVPLTKWFYAIRLMRSAKKGISGKHLERELGVNYRTAWSMGHRIRVAMKDEMHILKGIVEVDETWVGGKARNRHTSKRSGKGGGPGSGKVPVIGAVERNGRVVVRAIDREDVATVTKFVNEAVAHDVSLLVSDTAGGYRFLIRTHSGHQMINHNAGRYVVGAVHTNTIESFWSIFKRGIVGTFRKFSKKYLHLYVAEFQFRHNMRKEQGGMFDMVLRTSF